MGGGYGHGEIEVQGKEEQDRTDDGLVLCARCWREGGVCWPRGMDLADQQM